MKNFDDMEALVNHMLEEIDIDYPVSVVADKDTVVEVLGELLTYDKIILNYANISSDYTDEYTITLEYDTDREIYYILVHPAIDVNKNKYFSIGGYVLFHENVNSKAQVDMENNKFLSPIKCDWFTIDGEDIEDIQESEASEGKKTEATPFVKEKYVVNDKSVTKEEYDKAVADLDKRFYSSLFGLCDFINEMNQWRRFIDW